MNGGNVLAAGATLFEQDLRRNNVIEPKALYDIIYKGKGKMPGFGLECAPKVSQQATLYTFTPAPDWSQPLFSLVLAGPHDHFCLACAAVCVCREHARLARG